MLFWIDGFFMLPLVSHEVIWYQTAMLRGWLFSMYSGHFPIRNMTWTVVTFSLNKDDGDE
jgi:hypothetical protein